MSDRPGWDQTFLGVAKALSVRADCRRRLVGAVLVDSDHKIIGSGYNGYRAGLPGCLEGACPRGMLTYSQVLEFTDYSDPSSPGYCISTHAEMNAMLHAGRDYTGGTMYITDQPCPGCHKAMFNAGIKRVVYGSSIDNWQQIIF